MSTTNIIIHILAIALITACWLRVILTDWDRLKLFNRPDFRLVWWWVRLEILGATVGWFLITIYLVYHLLTGL